MGFRLILLLGMGLGAMYMMHLLAQDYNRIRQPAAVAGRILASASANVLRGKREVQASAQQQQQLNIDWKRILSRDPLECLQSLICQIMSGAENKSVESSLLIDFLESSLSVAPAKISRAFSRGLALRGAAERCYDEYPFCLFSASTMFRLLRWFSDGGYQELK